MNQNDLFGNPIAQQTASNISIGLNVVDGGEFVYYPDYFSKDDSDRFLKYLINDIAWQQDTMNMYGKLVKFPRLTAWYGNGDKGYKFSGITLNPHCWTPELLEIKNKICDVGKVDFNSVLLNRYRTGEDWISWHQDAEKELGKNPVIGSANFGATRKFEIRHLRTKETKAVILKHGSLLVMTGALQHNWQHQVPKLPKKEKQIGERINLTFRVIY